MIIQDADLEYDPDEYPVTAGAAARRKGRCRVRIAFPGSWSPPRSLFLALRCQLDAHVLSNCFTNINLSDMETCYKVFRREVIQSIPIEEDRFGFEPEITVKVAKRRLRIYEVGISYWGRTYEEGKKIGWRTEYALCGACVKYSVKEPVHRTAAIAQRILKRSINAGLFSVAREESFF